MTTYDRFDPFERRITEAIDEIAAARPPAYIDDILRQTARTSQRPRWTFPERWLPVDSAISRPAFFGRLPLRQLIVLGLVVALAAAALALYAGQQRRLAPPFGPAGNGQLAYSMNGDIYVRDTLTGTGRLLIGGANKQFAPAFSPDGTRISYVTDVLGSDPFYLANADGSNPVQVALIQPAGNAQAVWAPDSRRMALIYEVLGVPTLSIATVDGKSQAVDLGGLTPWDVAWLAPNGDRLIIRAQDAAGRFDLYTLRPDGTDRKAFGLPASPDWGTYQLSGLSQSPDGKTVVYNGIDEIPGATGELHQHFRLHLIGTDGTNDRAIPGPENPLVHENWPLFSPDGKWIAAQRWQFDRPEGGLVILPSDGSQQGRAIGPQTIGGNLGKVWAPDSSRILMISNDTSKIYSIDPSSGVYEQITWADDIPDWQRVALP